MNNRQYQGWICAKYHLWTLVLSRKALASHKFQPKWKPMLTIWLKQTCRLTESNGSTYLSSFKIPGFKFFLFHLDLLVGVLVVCLFGYLLFCWCCYCLLVLRFLCFGVFYVCLFWFCFVCVIFLLCGFCFVWLVLGWLVRFSFVLF